MEIKVEMICQNWKHLEINGYYKCRENESFDKVNKETISKKEGKMIDTKSNFLVCQ